MGYALADAGRAYGFFDCRATRPEIESYLPAIRTAVRSPPELRLSLIPTTNLRAGTALRTIASRAESEGARYTLGTSCAGTTNRIAADEAAAVLNQAYQSPLFRKAEAFHGDIVFKEGGRYVLHE